MAKSTTNRSISQVGKLLKGYRDRWKVPRRIVCEELALSLPYIYKIEKGYLRPSEPIEKLIRMYIGEGRSARRRGLSENLTPEPGDNISRIAEKKENKKVDPT